MKRVVVMGVSGSGKSSVGRELADVMGVPFADGDALHSAANVAKMASGVPLMDNDRWPWLADVGAWLAGQTDGGVVACSALKRSYRDALRAAAPGTRFVHLFVDEAVLATRMGVRRERDGHFMAPGMLSSQLADLEPLARDEEGLSIDVTSLSIAGAVERAFDA
jgi:gluconokinase